MAARQTYRWIRTLSRFVARDPWNASSDAEFSLEAYRFGPRVDSLSVDGPPNAFGLRSEIDGIVRSVAPVLVEAVEDGRTPLVALPDLVAESKSRTIGDRLVLDVGDGIFNLGRGGSAQVPMCGLNAALATVSYRLEPDGVGTRFPAFAQLRRGWIDALEAEALAAELPRIAAQLTALPVRAVVWELSTLRRRDDSAAPVNRFALNAHDYLITRDNQPVIHVLAEAAAACARYGAPLVIAPISKLADRRRRMNA
jgi:hypothetical protein